MPGWLGGDARRTKDVLYIGLLIVLSVAGLTLTFRTPALAGVLMAGVLALALWRWHEPLDLLLVAVGLCAGPTLEYFATTTGLWHYAFPSFSGLPVWVFTLWPVYPVCLVRLVFALAPPGAGHRRHAWLEVALGLGVLALEIPLLCRTGTDLPHYALIGTLVLLGPVFALTRSLQAVLMLVISGVVGPVCESIPVLAGAWSYPAPFALGLPLWLPTGYALFGFAMVRLALGVEALLAEAAAVRSTGLGQRS